MTSKKNILRENPEFLQISFQKDLNRFLETDEDLRRNILMVISEADSYSDLLEEKAWVELSETTEKPIDDFMALYKPIRYISAVAVTEEISLDEILDELGNVKRLGENPTEAKKILKDFCNPVIDLLKEAVKYIEPGIPVPRIKSMHSRCNLITEFVNEFNISKDSPDDYEPKVKKYYPYTTIHILLDGQEERKIVFGLNKIQIDNLMKFLALARIQLKKVEDKFGQKEINSEDNNGQNE